MAVCDASEGRSWEEAVSKTGREGRRDSVDPQNAVTLVYVDYRSLDWLMLRPGYIARALWVTGRLCMPQAIPEAIAKIISGVRERMRKVFHEILANDCGMIVR